jgi:hypothetical protein
MREASNAGAAFEARLTFSFIDLPNLSKGLAIGKTIRVLEVDPRR